MKLIKYIAAALLSTGLGLIFLYSGYTKLLPVIETFEFSFVDIGVGNWYTAPVMARLLIGLEFFLGLLLILNYNLKKFTLPFTAGLLLFFIIYLGIQIFTSGDKGNCGCFGEHLPMTPSQAILKNVILLMVCLVIYFLSVSWKIKFNALFLSLTGLTILFIPFVVNPIDYAYNSNNLDEKVNYPLELNLLYQPEDTVKIEVPNVELRTGKHVLAFMSLTCQHCRVAAKKFRLIKKNNPQLPVYFILNGDKKNYAPFIEDTKADNIPNSFCLGKTFIHLASTSLPRIYYLNNGIVVKKVDYFELNQYAIEKWIETGELD
jgi:hypothetical protein